MSSSESKRKPRSFNLNRLKCRVSASDLAPRIWESINTPVSLSCALLFKYGEHAQLAEKKIDPSRYKDPASFFDDYQSVKLLAKYPGLKTGIDTEAVAYKKFLQSEIACMKTNMRIRERDDGTNLFAPRVERIISNAQRKISSILGRVPELSELDFRFGPGATFGVRGETSPYNKVTADLECTDAMTGRLSEFLEEFPGWIAPGTHDVRVVSGSQLAFVPKDATTDRPICIEPLLNGLMQKGIGSWMRSCLHRYGIDLNDQSVNQFLASQALVRGLSTVDFSSASDTIAYRTVLMFLPVEWVEILDRCRSPNFWDGKHWVSFHKFSSMGNAYTFELETLIFYSVAQACCEELGIRTTVREDISVYGDDVIIPSEAFDLFQEVSESVGFTINENKSFRDGLFFESCGHDYFGGKFVRPFLWKRELNKLTSAFYACNTIKRIAQRRNTLISKEGCDRRLLGVYNRAVGGIPARLRRKGPEGFGDGHLISDFDDATPPLARDGWCGFVFDSFQESAIRHAPMGGDGWPAAYALYCAMSASQTWDRKLPVEVSGRELAIWARELKLLSPTDNSAGYTIRGRTKIKKVSTFCPSGRWANMGPWA